MKFISIVVALMTPLLATTWGSAQEAAPPHDHPPAKAVIPPEGESPRDTHESVTALRERVHDLRRTVLGGGEAVHRSEKEAMAFYRRKSQKLAARVDDLLTSRDAKEVEYDAVLERALEAGDPELEVKAVRRAAKLRGALIALDAEIETEEAKLESLGRSIEAIRKRMEHRKAIMDGFDTAGSYDGIPLYMDDVFGPDDEIDEPDGPFTEEGVWEDLLSKDPRLARRLLRLHDPQRYWRLFPLSPPEKLLRRALEFPAPDLPGRRR